MPIYAINTQNNFILWKDSSAIKLQSELSWKEYSTIVFNKSLETN